MLSMCSGFGIETIIRMISTGRVARSTETLSCVAMSNELPEKKRDYLCRRGVKDWQGNLNLLSRQIRAKRLSNIPSRLKSRELRFTDRKKINIANVTSTTSFSGCPREVWIRMEQELLVSGTVYAKFHMDYVRGPKWNVLRHDYFYVKALEPIHGIRWFHLIR